MSEDPTFHHTLHLSETAGPEHVGKLKVVARIMQLPPGHWDVKVTKHKAKRSVSQNAMWQALVNAIALHSWESPGRMKDILKNLFLGCEEVEVLGEKHMVLRETSALTPEEFSNLIEQTTALAIEYGVPLQEVA